MREEFWKIQVHEDKELASLVKEEIRCREKLHHWPLSYVEKVTLQDGRTIVYKAQHRAASVENAFYAQVRAPFLLEPIFLAEGDDWAALALPYVDHASQQPRPATQLQKAVGQWNALLQPLKGIPIYFDISSPEKLLALLEDVYRAFPREEALLASLDRWLEQRAPLCYSDEPIGILHGDLTGGNVITDQGKLRYILDWQRPIKGPLALETPLSLQNAGFSMPEKDPFDQLALIVRGFWYAYAYLHLLPFPELAETAGKLFWEAWGARE